MKGFEVVTQQQNNRTTQSSATSTKPTYKEYQKFLSTYNDSKSDQQQSSSPIALSTNSSTSSVPSVVSETDSVPVAFNEYLQNYGSKKYSTVKPNLPKKNVKTEIFIQVNDEDDKESLYGRRFNTLKSRKPPGRIILARQNSLNKCDSNNWKNPISPAGHQVVLSPPPAKQETVPDAMIYAKTALLNELSTKPPKLNKSPSPTFKSTIEVVNNATNSAPSLPPPPPKLPDFTSKPPPISLTVTKVTPATTPPKQIHQSRPNFISEMQSKFNENSQKLSSTNGYHQNPEKKSPPLNSNFPPKFMVQLSKGSENNLNGTRVVPDIINFNSDIPPPPPKYPPPSMNTINFEIKPVVSVVHSTNGYSNGVVNGKRSPPIGNANLPPPPKFLTQQAKTLEMEGSTTTYVPVSDASAAVDKSDPNVKKLVYNTYRGLLGAYNNKANNMVTLPRNRVVQDQGVTKQLESIE